MAQSSPQQIAQRGGDRGRRRDPRRGETVLERPRPELDPLGVPVASFLVFPSFQVRADVDDNVFRDDSDTRSDFITRLQPRVRVRSDWDRHDLRFFADADIAFHYDNTSEDYEDARLGTIGRIDIDRESFATLGVNFERLHEDRGSPDDAGGDEPTEFRVLTGDVGGFHAFGRFNASLDSRVESIDYDDVDRSNGTTINNDDRDRTIFTVSGRFGYEIVPDYEAFVRATGNWRIYDSTPDDAGLTRNSEGVDLVAGLAIDLGGILFGDFFAGYKRQEFKDSDLETIEGPNLGVDLTWNVTPLTTIVGSFSRTIRETTRLGASGIFTTRADLSLDHELLRNLLILLDGGYRRDDFEGIGRNDDRFRASLQARYLINRYAYLTGGYRFTRRNSSVSGQDFTNNVGSVSLRLQY